MIVIKILNNDKKRITVLANIFTKLLSYIIKHPNVKPHNFNKIMLKYF